MAISFISNLSFAQVDYEDSMSRSKTVVDTSKYAIPDSPAVFPGGVAALRQYLASNVVYPNIAVKNGVEGKCYLTFVVSDKGKITNVKVKKGVIDCSECDEEAVRVIKAMPDWTPAKVNGQAVNSIYSLPITFNLAGSKRKRR